MNFASPKKWMLATGTVILAVAALITLSHFPFAAGPPAVIGEPKGKPERAQVFLGPRNSVAMLPFSGAPDRSEQAFWSYGFSRELLSLLIRAPGLRVTSPNSAFFFLGQSVPLPLVAERLQVRYLLSGQFLVGDGQLQVSVTLFDAKKKAQAWSLDFAGDPGEVFRIQDEILAATVESVDPGNRDELPRARPVDGAAWAAYLEGLYQRAQRTEPGFEAAEQAFQAALGLAPDFATARVNLAGLWLEMNASGLGETGLVERARQALGVALLSEPDLPEALGLLSYVRRNKDRDWQGALVAAQEALRLSPGDPELMSTASLAMFSLGQFGAAGELLSDSVSQDPLNLSRRLQLGLLQEFAGHYVEALATYRLIIGLNPDFPGVRAYRARIKLIQDKAESALEESELEVNPFWKRYAQVLALTALGREEEAQPLLEQMITEDGDTSAYQLAEIMAFRGEIGLAFEWLQRADEQKDGGMSELIGNFFLGNLHTDPRWADLLKRLGLPLPDPAQQGY